MVTPTAGSARPRGRDLEPVGAVAVVVVEEGDDLAPGRVDAGVAGRRRSAGCSRRSTRTRGSPSAAGSCSSGSSPPPSSTTRHSQSSRVWPTTDATASATRSARRWVGTTTENVGASVAGGRPASLVGASSGPPGAAPPGSVDEDEVVSMGCVHILYLIPGLDGSGGAERAVAAMAGPYRDRGVQLDVVTFNGRDGLAAEVEAAGATVLSLPAGVAAEGGARGPRAGAGRGAPTWCTPRCSTPTWPAGSAAGLGGAPVVSSLVNVAYGPEQRANPALKAWKLEVARGRRPRHRPARPAVPRPVGARRRRSWVPRLGIPPDRIDVVPRGRDRGRLGPPGARSPGGGAGRRWASTTTRRSSSPRPATSTRRASTCWCGPGRRSAGRARRPAADRGSTGQPVRVCSSGWSPSRGPTPGSS